MIFQGATYYQHHSRANLQRKKWKLICWNPKFECEKVIQMETIVKQNYFYVSVFFKKWN